MFSRILSFVFKCFKSTLLLFKKIDVFIYLFIFRERGREAEREGEKHQSVASHMRLDQGPGLKPRYVL